MYISIHDYANNRVIIAEVPAYITDLDHSSDDIAIAILATLGLNTDECEYMIGEFIIHCDQQVRNDNGTIHKIEELTQDFKDNILEQLSTM